MTDSTIGIILNGVTGRMGTNQHLVRSILAIRKQGGILLADGSRLMPEPLLVGRNEAKLRSLAQQYSIDKYSLDLDTCLADSAYQVYFDAQTTELRYESVRKAIAAGKHMYCEKPSAATLDQALELYRYAESKGVKHGVVQDKLFLPGLKQLAHLIASGYFGTIHSVRGEFGYWVFDGFLQLCQRPSWNYRKEDGGSIIFDMFCHWRYVIDNLFGPVAAVSCIGSTAVDRRIDEQGVEYACTADDTAYATFQCANGVICQFNSSWATRVRRDDLLTIHVDGSKGSAVAGLRSCFVQPDATTPKPVWNPDIASPLNYFEHWQKMPVNIDYDNAFKSQWELFLRHVAEDAPFPWTLLEGAKGVQLAELAQRSWQERRWVDVPEIAEHNAAA